MTFRVLYVCTGNVCRSPMAASLLRGWVDDARADLAVSSAGTAALVGEPMDAASASAVTRLGVVPPPHRARQFDPAMALRADLVLTAEQAHRDLVMAQAPAAFRRTFTMKEFARLAPRATATGAAAVIAQLAHLRGVDGAIADGLDDVLDPYRGTTLQAADAAQQVAATVRAVLDVLALPLRADRVRPQPTPAARPRPVPRAVGPHPGRPGPKPRPRPRPEVTL